MRSIRLGAGGNAKPKYGNKKTELDGIVFDSKREAARYQQLKLLERGGLIRDLKIQVPYRLEVNGLLICKYIADFTYEERHPTLAAGWLPVTEDSKGFPNDRWPMKRKLMRACHGIQVRET